ncbi:MAG: single-stranded-DNA-specific exonuclease RecJ [Hyphomicrobiales bacterium]
MSRTVFDVSRSVTDRAWVDRADDSSRAVALAMVQQHGLPDVVARILAGRDVPLAALPGFLDPRLRDLMPDPFVMTAMEPAALRIADAVERDETVAIFGDYDVDGATSVALLAGFLDRAGVRRLIHIPDRLTEGYGPNVEAVRLLVNSGAHLLVTVDCGTTGNEPILEAAKLGVPTVVLDHHQAPEELPEAYAIVNPNRLDDLSGLGHLCAAGVVFMTLVAVNRILRARGFWAKRGGEPDLMAMLDLVALGTVADMVPLIGLNRAFVRQGIAVMRRRDRPGLRALADVARLDGPIAPDHLGFLFGPRINAGGRIGDAALGARLLLTGDENEAAKIATELERLNRERQEIEVRMVEEAEAEALLGVGLDENAAGVIVVASSNWHPGIVGLVASRLKERFRRPVFALAIDGNGYASGSGRSVQGIDLGRAVRDAVEQGILIKGGGHAMAAGLTIIADRIPELRAYFDMGLGADASRLRADQTLVIDAAITAGGATLALLADIDRAGPFGSGFPAPLVAFAAHRIVDAMEVGANHVRTRLKAADGMMLEAVAFQAVNQPIGITLMKNRGGVLHMAGSLAINRYRGRETVQLRIADVAVPQLR